MDKYKIRQQNLIKLVNDNHNGNIRECSLKRGIDYSSLYKYYHGQKTIGDGAARNLAEKFNINKSYLDGETILTPIESEIIAIPVHEATLAAGSDNKNTAPRFDRVTSEFIYIADPELRNRYINDDCLEAFKVEGDSMEYTINQGSYVVVDRKCLDIIDNKIYAIAYGDDLTARVKRLRKTAKGLLIISDNKHYGDELIEYGSNIIINIIGKVVYLVNKF